jgi:hypothetical protein
LRKRYAGRRWDYDGAFIKVELRVTMHRFALCCLAALVLLIGCKKDVSGSYLVNDNVAVCWLQVVRTPDDHLTGQLVSSVLKPDGKIDHESVSLTGAVNGENLTLTGGGLLGMATTTLSGTFDGNTLTLTGVQSTPVTLKRANLADYQAELGEQAKRSEAIISARATAAARQRTFQAQKNFVAQIDQAVNEMQRFDAEADYHLARFPNAEKGYEAITAKVNEYVTRERQLVGNPDRAVDRSQLYVSANQASLDTDQMHYHAQSIQSSLQMDITPLVNEVTGLEQACHQDGSLDTNLTPVVMQAHKDACSRLLSAAPMFHQKYAAMVSGLNNLEGVYKREKDTQARLLATAEKME